MSKMTKNDFFNFLLTFLTHNYSEYCDGKRVELFQRFRTNKTVTCDESSYGLNTGSVINCAPN